MFAVLLTAAAKTKALLIPPGEHTQTARESAASHPTETHLMAGANQWRNGTKEKVTATQVCSNVQSMLCLLALFALVIRKTALINCGTLHLPAAAGSNPEV